MLLGEILHARVVKTNLEALEKFEAIEELVDLLVDAHDIPMSEREHVIEVVTAREQSMSTGMEHGVALPHGTTDRITDIVAALGISQDGLPFETLDGHPARLIILLLLPKHNYPGHVRTLAGIAHLLINDAFRDALIEAADVDALLALIQSEEDRGSFEKYR
jgi:mannitol/fructose-specific phosphotransferase system IIA component (Ntr-type)